MFTHHKMKKLIEIINKLTPKEDKLKHFFWGFVYALVSYVIGVYLLDSKLFTMFLPVAFGAAKEIYDDIKYGGFDVEDLFYTLIPSFIITLIILQ